MISAGVARSRPGKRQREHEAEGKQGGPDRERLLPELTVILHLQVAHVARNVVPSTTKDGKIMFAITMDGLDMACKRRYLGPRGEARSSYFINPPLPIRETRSKREHELQARGKCASDIDSKANPAGADIIDSHL